ncbi:hypothetical protein ACMU_18415 [Actibacterium mucosum KCTC 23349]|uniref:Periplasmic binding protein domain-containing protein n=2 Tax=Actibacterium TaxID=1433986 RepID=A0A037ZE76_9RHOB|nr:hypothetical protein ACMU_18415 [Actibacterium mucosum KCTC 23349]
MALGLGFAGAAMAGDLGAAYKLDTGQLASKGPSPELARTGQEPAPKQAELPIKVGFTPTAMNTHYDIVIAGAKQAIKDLGGESVIDLHIQAPTSQSGIGQQMNIVETWVQRNYDVITMATANDQAMMPMYERAAKKGIPVFMFNMPTAMSTNPFFVSNVGYDQHEAGRLIGLYVKETYGDTPTNLVILEGLPGVHNTQRLTGFKEGLGDTPNVKIIASQPAGWVRSEGQSVMENILTAHPDDIDVVWGMYDEMALGALAAIKGRGAEGIDIIGYDNTPDAYDAIKRGDMHVTVDTAAKEMGYNLIMAVHDYAVKGQMVDKVINSEVVVWDGGNIDAFDTDNYVFVE